MSFVDRVQVSVKAGAGGAGALSFRHEKFRARGGPDGGDGGAGGSVIVRASRNQNTLAAFRYKKLLQAKGGSPGGKRKKHGKKGEDLEVEVPIGTLVTDTRGQVLADLVVDGQTELIAQGGQGGFGNAHFTNSTRQAPRVAEKGEKGQEFEAVMELKMIADTGIVGLPNAGKSTFLSVVSNAKPEIADYPFTTLVPNLGVVDIDQKHSLLLADIPGLIEGASQGKGLGDEFLRHVERTSVLLHLVDAYSQNVAQDYKTIINELAEYKTDLSQRPQVVALTKIEGLDKKQINDQLKKLKKIAPKGTPVLSFSSLSRQGLDEILRALLKRVEQARKRQDKTHKTTELPVIGLRESDDDWYIQEINGIFVVTGAKIERFARRTDFNNQEGVERLRDIMRKLGIIRELERKGAKEGDSIEIGQPTAGRLKF